MGFKKKEGSFGLGGSFQSFASAENFPDNCCSLHQKVTAMRTRITEKSSTDCRLRLISFPSFRGTLTREESVCFPSTLQNEFYEGRRGDPK